MKKKHIYNRVKECVTKIKDSRFISFINTDSNKTFKNEMLYLSYEKAFNLLLIDFTRLKTNCNLDMIKQYKNKIIFIFNYEFNNDSCSLLRSIYDSISCKIIVLPKYSFSYESFTTDLSGRVEIINFYCNKFLGDEIGCSFKEYILNIDCVMSDNKTDSLLYFNKTFNKNRIACLIHILAESIGEPLSIREIMRKMEEKNFFLHPRMAPNIISQLIKMKIIIECEKYDENRNKIVKTNKLYFFNSNNLLRKYLETKNNDKLLLNAFFLELYYRGNEIQYLKDNHKDVYSFLFNKNGNDLIIIYTYDINKILKDVLKSIRKRNINAAPLITSIYKPLISQAFGIKILYVDYFLNKEVSL